jgi:predicted small lipoprotein YifL
VIPETLFPGAGHYRALALATFVALVASGCGRIGPLEPPPGANAPAAAAPAPEPGSAEALNPQVKPKIPPVTPPKQPFFLDFLLK